MDPEPLDLPPGTPYLGDATIVWETPGLAYAAAVENIDVLPDVDAAVSWVNDFVRRIS